MGTALTENQVRELKRLTKRFVLALDADKAGDAATRRGLEVGKEVLRGDAEWFPVAKTLVAYEDKLEAEIRIVVLPPGQDPDRVMREDAAQWVRLLEGAVPTMDYYLDRVASRFDLTTAKGKSRAVKELLPLINLFGDKVERGHYLSRLSRLVKIDERVLLSEVAPRRSLAWGREGTKEGPLSGFPGYLFGPEKGLLLLFLEEPRLMKRVDEELEGVISEPLAPEDFEAIENCEIFSALRRWLSERMMEGEEGGMEEPWDLERFGAHLDTMLQERFTHLLDLRSEMSILVEKDGVREAVLCALRLRGTRLRRNIEAGRMLVDNCKTGYNGAVLS